MIRDEIDREIAEYRIVSAAEARAVTAGIIIFLALFVVAVAVIIWQVS